MGKSIDSRFADGSALSPNAAFGGFHTDLLETETHKRNRTSPARMSVQSGGKTVLRRWKRVHLVSWCPAYGIRRIVRRTRRRVRWLILSVHVEMRTRVRVNDSRYHRAL
jgi:hypothetical protein